MLGFLLHFPGEQDRVAAVPHAHHDRVVVDVGRRVVHALDTRPDDVDRRVAEPVGHAGDGSVAGDAAACECVDDLVVGGEVGRRVRIERASDRERFGDGHQPVDVIGVRVADHEQVDPVDALRAQSLEEQRRIRAAVDQHRVAPLADEDRVSLADVDHRHDQAVQRRRAERARPGPSGHQQRDRKDDRRDALRALPARSGQRPGSEGRREQEPDRAGRRAHRRERKLCERVCDPLHPCDRRAGEERNRAQRAPQRAETGRRHPADRCRRHGRHRDEVRADRDQRDLVEVQQYQRRDGQLRAQRDRSGLRELAVRQVLGDARRDDEYPERREDGELEPDLVDQERVVCDQRHRRRGEHRRGGAARADRHAGQRDGRHRTGAKHAGLEARDRAERQHAHRHHADRRPPAGARKAQEERNHDEHHRDVLAAHGQKVGETGRPEVEVDLGCKLARIADRHSEQQPALPFGQVSRRAPHGRSPSFGDHDDRVVRAADPGHIVRRRIRARRHAVMDKPPRGCAPGRIEAPEEHRAQARVDSEQVARPRETRR